MHYLFLITLLAAASVCAAAEVSNCRQYEFPQAAGPIDAEVAAAPGFFLEVRRGDAPPSYMLGTVHTAHPDVIAKWGRTVLFAAAMPIRIVITERDTDPQTSDDPRYLDAGESLRDLLSADDGLYDAIVRTLNDDGLDSELVDRMQPWYLSAFLQQASVQRFPTSALIIDEYLSRQLSRLGIERLGLESLQDLANRYDTNFSRKELVRLLWEGVCNRGLSHIAISDQTAAFAANDVGALYRLMTRYTSQDGALADKMIEVFVRQRNRRFRARLEPELVAGGAFVVLGNLHLFGDEGLWQRFVSASANDRFTVRAIDPDAYTFLLEPADITSLLGWVLKHAKGHLQMAATLDDFENLRVQARSIIRLREDLCPDRRCNIDATYGLDKNTIHVADGVFARLMLSNATPQFRVQGSGIVKRYPTAPFESVSTDAFAESILARELTRHLIYRIRHPGQAGPRAPKVRPTQALSERDLIAACIDNRALHDASIAQQAYLRDQQNPRSAHVFALSPECGHDIE